ncbi:hypothetical protein CYMTET_51995 [Cymbomonas tetramitiformis]|uniref:ABC-2 type transporter transmembrane domain-containing protein n=1 Tax=Cymbomonas tetramitiformis TaxID=36881 RepID=A0AAE0BK46_9CHLO|nr:hypothetical protein CYMTET_51995 [Cymbomonas tetramitiformis]
MAPALWEVGINSLVIGVCSYCFVGLHPLDAGFENFLDFMGIIVIIACWGNVLGLTLGIIVDSADSASSVSMPVLLINVLFSGFVITSGAIPVYFIWCYYLSFFHYCLSGMLVTIFKDMEFSGCDSDRDESENCPFGTDGDGTGTRAHPTLTPKLDV